ncbi:adult-specific cuticular protein ACP-20-like [Ochlerotatus camptorhynchus]|uniref:adult-specific cuticular protein ACP-20-like n=1 Tax=Ochlerotatus camptorhynchus TaxID=644619 RepID=UPI0031D249E3
MLKLSVVIVALFSLSIAYKQHSYVTHVKHIPYKKYAGMESIQEEGQQGGMEGQQEGEQGEGQEGGIIMGDGQEGADLGMEMGAGEGMGEIGGEMGVQNQMQGGHQQDEFGQDYYTYPKYKFEYGVKDYHTGDDKSQWEIRDGDFVKGEYRLADADGTHRIVRYKADDHNGFQAEVKQIGKGFEHHGGQDDEQGDIGGGHAYSYTKLKRYL